MNAPCKGCTQRRILCHSICPIYKQYEAEREELRKAKRQYQEYRFAKDDSYDHTVRKIGFYKFGKGRR